MLTRSSARPDGSNTAAAGHLAWPVRPRSGWRLPAGRAAAPRFYSDDPLAKDPESQDASKVQAAEGQRSVRPRRELVSRRRRARRRARRQRQHHRRGARFELVHQPGRRRHGPLDLDALVKGPDTSNGPAPGPWTVIARKGEGVTPGFTIRDSAGEIYWIKFDPEGFAEMASGAEVISTKFFHAFGYHVAENYLATLPSGRSAGRARRHHEGRGRPQPAPDARGSRRDSRARGAAGRRQLPRARQPQHRGPAAGTVPLSRHASRRSQRHRPPRTPSRAARPVGLRRLAESRRGPELELARQRRGGGQPADRPPPPARFRLDARQRQHQGAEPARRQRVRVGVAADADHDADPRALRAALDQGAVSG